MPNDPNGRKTVRRPPSAAAQADIADRLAAARPKYLADLAVLSRARLGRATVPQLVSLAAILARVPGRSDDLSTTLRRWVKEAGGSPPPYLDALAAKGADAVELSRRELVAMWAVTAEEEEGLDLQTLISEARRSRLRRDATRVDPAPAAVFRPLAAPSADRATRRRAASAAEQEAVARVYHAAGVTPPPQRGSRPWEAAGVSRATWYRQQGGRETNPVQDGVRRHVKLPPWRHEELPPLREGDLRDGELERGSSAGH